MDMVSFSDDDKSYVRVDPEFFASRFDHRKLKLQNLLELRFGDTISIKYQPFEVKHLFFQRSLGNPYIGPISPDTSPSYH